jgi:integrase
MGRPREGWKLRDPRGPGDPYTVRFTDKEGRPRELSTGTSDPGQAALVAAELYAKDLTTGLAVGARIDPTLALDELLASWLADLHTTHDPETLKTYTAYAREYVTHFKTFANITAARMGDFQRWQLGKTVRDTVSKKRSAMNGFLDWCVEQRVILEEQRPHWPKLPKKATGVRSGPQREKPVDVTPEQVRAFIAALPIWSRPRFGRRHAIRARFIVAYQTGLRPGTLDELTVPRHWSPGANEIVIEDQHDKARYGRKVPITAAARAALEVTVAELGIKDGPIFGKHDYREHVEKAAKAAGIHEDFAIYDLRHGRIGHLLLPRRNLNPVSTTWSPMVTVG